MANGRKDDWNDEDHYPMHPSHPGWNDQSAAMVRWRRVVPVLAGVLSAACAVVIAVRVLT